MAGNEVIGLEVTVALEGLKKQFAEIPRIADEETKAMTAAVSKNIRQLETAIKAQTKASKDAQVQMQKTSDAIGSTGASASKAFKALGPLGGVLARISPEAGAVASSVAAVTSGFEGLGAAGISVVGILGPVAPVVLGLGAAYLYLSDQVAKADKAVEDSANLADAATIAHDRFRKVVDSVGERYEIASGLISKAGAERAQTAREIEAASKAEQAEIAKGNGSLDERARRMQAVEDRANMAIAQLGIIERKERDAIKTSKQKVAGIDAEAEVEKIRVRLADQAAQKQVDLREEYADGQAEMAKAVEAALADEADAQAKYDEDLEVRQQERLEREKRYADAEISVRENAMSTIQDLAIVSANAIGHTNKNAALALFRVSQIAAGAEAAINTGLAVSNALADIPYPLNFVAAGTALAAGVAAEATIASQPTPTFDDTPAPMQMNRGGNVSLARGDFFAAAKTPADLRAQVGGTPQVVEVQQVYRHQVFAPFIRDNLRQGGPLASAIRGKTRVGHRTDR